jgi:lipoprotein-anchoring transpeptidase ErfK/SrfK
VSARTAVTAMPPLPARRRRRRVSAVVSALAVAIAVLLASAVGVAADRLRPRDPYAVEAISPDFTMLAVPAAAAAPRRTATQARARAPGGCLAPPVMPATPATAAIASGAVLDVYASPDGAKVRTLTNPTPEGQRLHVLVVEHRDLWLRVRLPVRPNGTTGWVRITDVTQFTAPYRLLVELCAHRITAYRAGKAVWQRPVAVGRPGTPTPTGQFFVDFVVPMPAYGAYGPFLLSVAGFSNVLQNWGGGIGQIALHGTNRPALIGTSASHGCVRMRNADVTYLAHLVPPGTPVTIVT